MKTLQDLKDELNDLLDAKEAIFNLADKEKRAFNDEEKAQSDALGDDKTGQICAKAKEIEAREKIDAEKKAVAVLRSRAQASPLSQGAQGPTSNAIALANPRHVMSPTKAFKNDADGHAKAFACGMWIRAALAHAKGHVDHDANEVMAKWGWDIRASQTEGTTTAGGYLVPDPLEAALIEYRQQVGLMRQLADKHIMTADSLSVPKLTSGQSVKYPGEATAITASDMAFAQIAFAAVKRSILSYISQELKDDAIINIMDQAVSRMAYEFAKQEDNEAINGDSTSTYGGETGILAAIGSAGVSQAATGHDTWPELDASDIAAWFAKLPSQHGENTVIVCSRAFYMSVFRRLMISAGGNDGSSLALGGGSEPRFDGIRCVLTDRMPTATAAATVCALYGNFAEGLALGDRMGVTFAMSDQYAFNQGLLAIRADTRYDWNAHNVGDSSNAGAIVALKTAA